MTVVGVHKDPGLTYDSTTPFHPAGEVPECPFAPRSERNSVYAAVRSLLVLAGLDRENFGTARWNPLGAIVHPGDRVLIKPNLVLDVNRSGTLDSLVTHPSVIRAMLDYVLVALRGQGEVCIGDASLQMCRFDSLTAATGLAEMVDFCRSRSEIPVLLEDLRLLRSHRGITGHIGRDKAEGSAAGYVYVDLGRHSALAELGDGLSRFRVTCYDKAAMTKRHNAGTHEYVVARRVLDADVIVNLPKLKAHRKAGMTGALKNLVGINGHKDCLPHHRFGSTEEGGDEYLHRSCRKELERRLCERRDVCRSRAVAGFYNALRALIRATGAVVPFRDPYREGSWYGNDTLPRTIADLNRIAAYADRSGVLSDRPQRRMFVLVDAVVAGEREGPLEPSDRRCGLLVCGTNPATVDAVCSELMGFDHRKIATLRHAFGEGELALLPEGVHGVEDIRIASEKCGTFQELFAAYGERFAPTRGWLGHIERDGPLQAPTSLTV